MRTVLIRMERHRRSLRGVCVACALAIACMLASSSAAAAAELAGIVVVKGGAGGPAAGATVSVRCADAGATPDTVATDAQGRFRVDPSGPNRKCRLTVKYANKDSNGVTVQLSGAITRVTLELTPGADRWGLVRR